MNKDIRDYGRVSDKAPCVYPERENIKASFLYRDTVVNVSCSILEQGFSDRRAAMHFDHPDPLFSRLFIFAKGGADISTPSCRKRLCTGNIYILPSNQPFKITYGVSKLLFFHLHICDETGQSLFDDLKGIPSISDPGLVRRFRKACAENDRMQILTCMMETIRILFADRLEAIAVKAEKSVVFSRLFEYLEGRPVAAVTIDELARLYSISPEALSKRFSRAMGIPLKSYLLNRQLRQAQEMLLHSEMTVSEIAGALGVSNSQYFHRFFRKYCKCTPCEYKAKYGQKNQEVR